MQSILAPPFPSRSVLPSGSSVGMFGVLGPFRQITGDRLEELFDYGPDTRTTSDGRTLLHPNAGWVYPPPDRAHVALYGILADLEILPRTWFLLEGFGEGTDLSAQIGLRSEVVPDRLGVDLSYGANVSGDTPAIGLAIGSAWTPDPFLSWGR